MYFNDIWKKAKFLKPCKNQVRRATKLNVVSKIISSDIIKKQTKKNPGSYVRNFFFCGGGGGKIPENRHWTPPLPFLEKFSGFGHDSTAIKFSNQSGTDSWPQSNAVI